MPSTSQTPSSKGEPKSHSRQESGQSVRSFGQVIEYVKDELFLASYTHPPNSKTPFPYLSSKNSSPRQSGSQTKKQLEPVYFSVDGALLYNAFHADFGPLHIGHLYRFASYLHEVLSVAQKEQKALVFWSRPDSRSRANAACLLACYMVLVQSWPPHLALAPIAQMDPPPMPFRDAGYSQADYGLTIQDVVYGVWRAKEEGLCKIESFNLEEYERYERVDMGDFNWVTPNFVAFASPQHEPTAVIPPSSPEYANLPKSTSAVYQSDLPTPFKGVLGHFRARKVGLVVRLNDALYSPSYFTALGMRHLDMIFDDGTCPPLALVRKFIRLAHDTITVKGRQVAVHCKAGLGRTGCLIGAYLIYRHGFTANEVVAYMRFMRPGMVVGPQQHWLHLNQGAFREWWFEDSMRDKMSALAKTATPPQHRYKASANGQTFTPPNASQKRQALGELDYNETGRSFLGVQDENLPAPTPGQPRKTSKTYGERQIGISDSENEPLLQPKEEIITVECHAAAATAQCESDESEEDSRLRMLSRRNPSPLNLSAKKRAVSCVTTMTTTTEWTSYPDELSQTAKTPLSNKSGSGLGSLSMSKRSSPLRKSSEGRGGVRKTSGRVGSAGAVAHATRIKQ